MFNNNNCRTCSKPLNTEECVNIGIRLTEDKSISELIHEWASVESTETDILPQFICKMCFISVKSFINFINLIRKSDRGFKELLCKEDKFNVIQNNVNQTSQNENNTTNKSQLFECTTCRKTFRKLYQYKTHMTVHTGEKNYSCEVCGKKFSRQYILIYHMRVHTGEKKFNCNFCNKFFIHPSNLYKHKKIHTNTRNYKCEFCTKSFIQSEALKVHVRRIHTGEKPFLCEICSKSFSCQGALWLHKQDSHIQKTTCPLCNKQFSRRVLKLHIERHKNKEQQIKKCICEQCGKNFSSAYNLRQHLLIHEGVKPYATQPVPCLFCKKSYSKRRIKSHNCIASDD